MICDLNFNCRDIPSFLVLNKMIDPEIEITDIEKKYCYLDGVRLQKVFHYLNQDFIFSFFENKELVKISITAKEQWLGEILGGDVFEIADKNINVSTLRNIFNKLICEIGQKYLRYS